MEGERHTYKVPLFPLPSPMIRKKVPSAARQESMYLGWTEMLAGKTVSHLQSKVTQQQHLCLLLRICSLSFPSSSPAKTSLEEKRKGEEEEDKERDFPSKTHPRREAGKREYIRSY